MLLSCAIISCACEREARSGSLRNWEPGNGHAREVLLLDDLRRLGDEDLFVEEIGVGQVVQGSRDLLRRHVGVLHLEGVHERRLEIRQPGVPERHGQHEELVDVLVEEFFGHLKLFGLGLQLRRLGHELVELGLDVLAAGVARDS